MPEKTQPTSPSRENAEQNATPARRGPKADLTAMDHDQLVAFMESIGQPLSLIHI